MQGVCVCVWRRLADLLMVFQRLPSRFCGDNQNCRFSRKQHRHTVFSWRAGRGSTCPGLRRHTHTLTGRSSVLETPYGVTGDLLSLCRLFLSSFLFFYLLTIVLCFDSQYMSCKCEELVWRRCVTPFTLSHTDCRWFDGMGSEGHADAIIPH